MAKVEKAASIDEDEIAKFTAMADQWWDPERDPGRAWDPDQGRRSDPDRVAAEPCCRHRHRHRTR